MAMTTDIARSFEHVPAKGRGIVTAGDRTTDFRSARRHSVLVRLMRVGFPLASLALVAIYAVTLMKSSGYGTGLPEVAVPRIIPEKLTMDNPRYEGFQPDGGRYLVKAQTAVQNLKSPNLIDLNVIEGDFWQADKTKTTLLAARGTFDNKGNVLDLFESIDVASESGLKAKLTRATVHVKDAIVVSKEPVVVELPSGVVRSKEMTLRQKAKEVTFTGGVNTHLKGQGKPQDKSTPEGEAAAIQAAGRQPPRAFGASDQPIDIVSNRLDVSDAAKTAHFTGSVRAVQAGAAMTTPEMLVTYKGNATPGAVGAAATANPQSGATADAAKVERILAKGPVVMTQANGDTVTSDAADFDAANSRALLTGNLVMTGQPDRKAIAERAEVDQTADTILLSAAATDVVVTQGRNELKGRRLFVDRKAGRTQLSAPAELGGKGRINARFVQGDPAAAARAAAAPKAEAAEASPNPFGTTFKTTPGAPIDIEANTLDVNDNAKAAVFRGDVNAVQGDFTVRTTELTAFYTGEAGLSGPASSQQQTATTPKQAAQLRKIEARKKVLVTSKNGQSATGDWADFDQKANTVVVGGDVTLTQGHNVVKGSRLTIDMTTGQSRIQTSPGSGWTASVPGSGTAPVVSGRPSALFYPKGVKPGTAPVLPKLPPKTEQPSNDFTKPDRWDAATQQMERDFDRSR